MTTAVEVAPGACTRVPEDPALPQLALALDSRRMTPLLEELHGKGAAASWRVRYVRYKPVTNCIVLYEAITAAETPVWAYAKLFAQDRAPRPSDEHRLSTYLPELRMALSAFPRDLQMPALRLAMAPEGSSRILRRVVPKFERDRFRSHWGAWEPLRYKPERRCVMKGSHLTAGGDVARHYARFYAGPEGAATANWHRHFSSLDRDAAAEVRTPALIGYSEEFRVLLIEELSGRPLRLFFDGTGGPCEDAIARTAKALTAWHRLPAPAGLPGTPPVAEQADISARAIAALLPEAAQLCVELAQALARTAPPAVEQPSLLHGDFYYDQVLIRDGEVAGVLDLDELCAGDPLHDVAVFCAHLRELEVREISAGRAEWISSLFTSAYEAATGGGLSRRGLAWRLGAALLTLATSSFRRFDQDWPRQVHNLLQQAAAAVDTAC